MPMCIISSWIALVVEHMEIANMKTGHINEVVITLCAR